MSCGAKVVVLCFRTAMVVGSTFGVVTDSGIDDSVSFISLHDI